MLQIDCLTLGDYQVNCYVVRRTDSNCCVLIDPGYEAERILAFLQANDLTAEAILLTHGHFDHVGAVEALMDELDCTLILCEKDWDLKLNPFVSWMYPLARRKFEPMQLCYEGDKLCLADLIFEVLETPGHTKGSVCFRCEDALFTGDTLFDGSCGRTDLPGGDHKTILASLQRLKSISENLRIFPGHGTSSMLDDQRLYNPYLR